MALWRVHSHPDGRWQVLTPGETQACARVETQHEAIAAAWPVEKRSADASYTVHRIFAPHPKRFSLVRKPPLDRRGRRHWTTDAATQAMGRASRQPQESRVRRIRELAADDTVAATVASEFLDRPDVAGQAHHPGLRARPA